MPICKRRKYNFWHLFMDTVVQFEYIEGRFNCCADLLSRLSSNTSNDIEGKGENELDVKDNIF